MKNSATRSCVSMYWFMIKGRARERNCQTWTVNIEDRYRGRKRRIGPRNCTFEQRDNRTTFTVPSALRFSGNRRTGARYRLRKTSVHALIIFPSSYALAVFVDTRQVRDRSESCAFNSHPDLLLLNLCVPIRLFIARYLNRIYRRTRRLDDFVKLINYLDIVR